MDSYKGFLLDKNLNIYNEKNGNKLKPYVGTDGYMHVARKETIDSLYIIKDEYDFYHIGTNRITKQFRERVHKIVGEIMVSNPNDYKYLNHIDSDKTNFDPNNLEWCTNSQNVKHGWESGNRTHKNRTKITVESEDGSIKRYNSIREASNELNIDRHKLARILKGESKNVYDYNFYYT